jgi:hypothetical protein
MARRGKRKGCQNVGKAITLGGQHYYVRRKQVRGRGGKMVMRAYARKACKK